MGARFVRVRQNGLPFPLRRTRSITHMATETSALTTHERLLSWVEEVVALTTPDAVHWCDGSAEEYDRLCEEMVEAGRFRGPSDAKRAESHPARLGPGDGGGR